MKPVTFRGKKYFRVTTRNYGFCEGCVFNDPFYTDGNCPHNTDHSKWLDTCIDDENEYLWIPATKKALANYVLKQLGDDDESKDSN